jgi:hypothetical protein
VDRLLGQSDRLAVTVVGLGADLTHIVDRHDNGR